jgi:hypothetical protein
MFGLMVPRVPRPCGMASTQRRVLMNPKKSLATVAAQRKGAATRSVIDESKQRSSSTDPSAGLFERPEQALAVMARWSVGLRPRDTPLMEAATAVSEGRDASGGELHPVLSLIAQRAVRALRAFENPNRKPESERHGPQ